MNRREPPAFMGPNLLFVAQTSKQGNMIIVNQDSVHSHMVLLDLARFSKQTFATLNLVYCGTGFTLINTHWEHSYFNCGGDLD